MVTIYARLRTQAFLAAIASPALVAAILLLYEVTYEIWSHETMPDLDLLQKRITQRKTIGWVDYVKSQKQLSPEIDPLPAYIGMALKINILNETEVQKIQRKFLKTIPIDAAEDGKRNRGNNQTRPDLDTVACALALSKHITNWRGFFTKTPITEQEWETLPPAERYPEEYPADGGEFYKKTPVLFHRPTLLKLIEQDLANYVVSLFFGKAAAYAALENEEFEAEAKNSANITPLVN